LQAILTFIRKTKYNEKYKISYINYTFIRYIIYFIRYLINLKKEDVLYKLHVYKITTVLYNISYMFDKIYHKE